jgi:hypothetical protein
MASPARRGERLEERGMRVLEQREHLVGKERSDHGTLSAVGEQQLPVEGRLASSGPSGLEALEPCVHRLVGGHAPLEECFHRCVGLGKSNQPRTRAARDLVVHGPRILRPLRAQLRAPA